MNNLVSHQKQFMDKDDALAIYEYCIKNTQLFNEFGNNEKEFTFHVNFNDKQILKILNHYGTNVWKYVVDKYKGNFEPFDSSKTHLAKFETGWGMHEHFDSTKPNDIATLIYINDDYSGGEIYFPDLGIEIKPSAGDLICFPDTPDFVHGVRKITLGSRYTSPRWITRIV